MLAMVVVVMVAEDLDDGGGRTGSGSVVVGGEWQLE